MDLEAKMQDLKIALGPTPTDISSQEPTLEEPQKPAAEPPLPVEEPQTPANEAFNADCSIVSQPVFARMRSEGPSIQYRIGHSSAESSIPGQSRQSMIHSRSATSTPILPGDVNTKASATEHENSRSFIPASNRPRSGGPQAPLDPLKPVQLAREAKHDAGLHSAVDLLPIWLQKCRSLHGDTCRPANQALEDEAPRFLVDLREKGHIITTKKGTSYDYVALSYHRQLQNRVNLSQGQMLELRNCKSLLGHPLLPPIVHDTMDLVRGIGERYVWIDFLCLAHGDDVVLDEMRRMDKIYAGALFTVIAACTDGLHERRPLSKDRPARNGEVLDAMTYHYKTLLKSTWATRGWTFQERMFSTRSIVFVPKSYVDPDIRRRAQLQDGAPDHCFFWECECAMWDDWDLSVSSAPCLGDGVNPSDPRLLRPTASTEQRLHFARYLQTIYYYNSREFRNPQDVLRAISGCLRRLSEDFSESFQSGFIYGLPMQKFHESLLWQPLGTSTRRECRCEAHHESPHQTLPSWSWCGWECELDLQSMPLDQRETLSDMNGMGQASWETRPTVHWELLWEDGTQEPMESLSSQHRFVERREWPLLTCEAYTARLTVRQVSGQRSGIRKALRVKIPINKTQSTRTRQVATLEDSDGTWAGVLGLTKRVYDIPMLPGQELQLMAISEGSMSYEKLEELHEEKTDKEKVEAQSNLDRNNPLHNKHSPREFYRFVNVLWIEEKNDRFSRKALGRVEARVWAKLCLGKRPTRIVLN